MAREIRYIRPFLFLATILMVIIYYVAFLRLPFIEYYRDNVFWVMVSGLLALVSVFFLAFLIGFLRPSEKNEGILLHWLAQNLRQVKFQVGDRLKIIPLLIEDGDVEYYGARIAVRRLESESDLEVDVNFGFAFDKASDINKANLAEKILNGEITPKAADICINKYPH